MQRKVNIVGIPSEIGAGTRGASLGINALKVAGWKKRNPLFQQYPIQWVPHQNDSLYKESPYQHARYIDAYSRLAYSICDHIAASLQQYSRNVILAGDHSTAAASIFALMRAYPQQRLGVVWIDAHADLHSPYTTPSGNMHGMPLALAICEDNLHCQRNQPHPETIRYWNQLKQLSGGKCLRAEDIVFIGLRSYEAEEAFLIEKYHIPHISVEDVRHQGVAACVEKTFDYLADCDIVYISFDVDSMDASTISGTGTPAPGGFSPQEALWLNRLLCCHEKVVCWEMVEINPTLDKDGNRVGEIAFDILKEIIPALEQQPAMLKC